MDEVTDIEYSLRGIFRYENIFVAILGYCANKKDTKIIQVFLNIVDGNRDDLICEDIFKMLDFMKSNEIDDGKKKEYVVVNYYKKEKTYDYISSIGKGDATDSKYVKKIFDKFIGHAKETDNYVIIITKDEDTIIDFDIKKLKKEHVDDYIDTCVTILKMNS